MNTRFGLVMVSITALLHPAVGMGADTGWTDVTVRVYDVTELPSADMKAALEVASATLSAADVEVTWRECAAGRVSTADACHAPMASGELAIRIVRSPAGTLDDRLLALGDALVDTHAGRGVLGTLYVDRVQRLASVARADARTLLGRAIAHELGHLLVSTSAHSTYGLMRAVWSRDEVQVGRERDWAFTKTDVAAIHRRVQVRWY